MSTVKAHNFENSFSGRLLRLLEEKGLSQDGLRLLLGSTSTGLVSNWVKRNRPPNAETLLKLAKILDTTPHYLLHGETPATEGEDKLNEAAQWRERALIAEKKLEAIQGAAGRLAEIVQGSLSMATKIEPELTDAQKAAKVAEKMVDEKLAKEKASSSASDEIASAVAEVVSSGPKSDGSKGHAQKAHGAKSK
ncbi:MAG TPA: helix-turn-helix domain-containing protein [Verrucomicrobiae bacterium]|nr:helix-turn-helix domain-containing protein [Verrucomicrobiae bacterium]